MPQNTLLQIYTFQRREDPEKAEYNNHKTPQDQYQNGIIFYNCKVENQKTMEEF